MDAIGPLVGVVLGGLLVLVGDFIRRRVEWQRELVKSLVTSGTDLVVMLHRTVGDLAEARETGAAVSNPDAGRSERLQVYSRFYANPGSWALRAQVDQIVGAHRGLRAAHNVPQDDWDKAISRYFRSVEAFELELHRAVIRGRPPRDPKIQLPPSQPPANLGVRPPETGGG
ncbi:hypothetical protein ACFP2T_27085 [Plantactinospora solaniradicis]|uniref:Uncharacterized protein n=1 Tax=Plantactinospora solaniradicis TaxID=1723736 RepID=A0ABW1KDJ3_9ACTN